MKACVPCGASCDDAMPTCESCGEASWAASWRPSAADQPAPPPHSEKPVEAPPAEPAAPSDGADADQAVAGDGPADGAPEVVDASIADQPAPRGGRRRKVSPPPAPTNIN